jgi:hypothetical protein
MLTKIQKLWNDYWWKNHPPEQVKYYKNQATEKARVRLTDKGITMDIRGEKYPFPGFPRGHILTADYRHTDLSVLKHKIKNEIFNYAWAELDKKTPREEIVKEIKKRFNEDIYPIMEKSRYDMLPYDKLCPAVKELWRAMTVLEKENPEIRKIKEIVCFLFQEDDGYRFRAQWLLNYFRPRRLKTFQTAMEQLENAEVLDDMKGRVRLWRRIALMALEGEEARRYFKLLCKEVDWRKIKLSKADKYYARGKWFKCDHKVYSY